MTMTYDHSAIRAAVRELVDAGDVTFKIVARETALSTATISQFVNNKYPGDVDAIADSLQKWLDNRTAAAEIPLGASFVSTHTSRQIEATLRYAHVAKRIAVIYGNSGVGKSEALRHYAENNVNVWLVTATPSTSSLLECLYEIAEAVGLDDAPRRSGSLMRAVRRKLLGTNGLLIIDEADHLTYDVLEELRLLQESIKVGLVLVGNHIIYSKLSGGNRKIDFARLFSRIAKRLFIPRVDTADVDAIADAWQLKDTERKLAHKVAAKAGALRTLSMTLDLAAMLAQGEGGAMTERHIRAAFKDIEGC